MTDGRIKTRESSANGLNFTISSFGQIWRRRRSSRSAKGIRSLPPDACRREVSKRKAVPSAMLRRLKRKICRFSLVGGSVLHERDPRDTKIPLFHPPLQNAFRRREVP